MSKFVCPGCGDVIEVEGVDRVTMQAERERSVLPGRVAITVSGSHVHQCADGAYLA